METQTAAAPFTAPAKPKAAPTSSAKHEASIFHPAQVEGYPLREVIGEGGIGQV